MKPGPLLEKGIALHRAGQLKDAEAVYRQLIQRWPKQADALYLLGLVVQQDGGHAEAIRLFAQAAKENRNLAAAHLQRGFSLNSLNQPDQAALAFKAAIAIQSNLSEAHHQLGNTLRSLNRLPEALASLGEATRLSPSDALFWLSQGVAFMDAQQLDKAVECFKNAVQLNASFLEARAVLGHALVEQHRTEEAREQLLEALRLRPNYHATLHDLGRVCAEEGLLAEAAEYYRAALAAQQEPETQSNLLFLLGYFSETTPEKHFAEHLRWAEWVEAPLRTFWQPHINSPEPNRRLRVGYVSPDLRDHPVASFFESVLRTHERQDFEVFCYSNVKSPDAVTGRLRGLSEQWRDIVGLNPERVAEMVRQDGIDILIDLAGHTMGNQLLVFARKPAPVQVTWLGYPNTTGLKSIDYRITDAVSDPPGQTEQWHSERIERLPGSFSCYCPPSESPAVGPLPAFANRHVTFGCFNNFKKVTEAVIELWAQLLREIPDARLIMKSGGLSNPKTALRLRDQFARAGVAADRIDLEGGRLSKNLHLASYNRVDIALDPFPYNGTTTTCDALWMGVPVVTLAGSTHIARVGVSLVSHLGFPEWAAQSPQAYVAKCQDLANNLPVLARLRLQLRDRMRLSPLCDAPQFTGRLEAALRGMWRRWCEQKQKS